jgi:hypothetical protein
MYKIEKEREEKSKVVTCSHFSLLPVDAKGYIKVDHRFFPLECLNLTIRWKASIYIYIYIYINLRDISWMVWAIQWSKVYIWATRGWNDKDLLSTIQCIEPYKCRSKYMSNLRPVIEIEKGQKEWFFFKKKKSDTSQCSLLFMNYDISTALQILVILLGLGLLIFFFSTMTNFLIIIF